ncbi:unnamed protein product [Brassica oleracea var. botrytis]|uniref:Uncharacterized protein n=2 Tax=Brassica TaxID=3705 RepID=A0A3P6GEP6_BRAOL|nr:unnamed protein product [Brassica napus]CDY32370.1 BnaC01g36890D [Brassica napus]VDD52569.1 unnamed protein product [Brassica oleracea]
MVGRFSPRKSEPLSLLFSSQLWSRMIHENAENQLSSSHLNKMHALGTISWQQGDLYPSSTLLSVPNTVHQNSSGNMLHTQLCFLPRQLFIYMWCLSLVVLSLLALFLWPNLGISFLNNAAECVSNVVKLSFLSDARKRRTKMRTVVQAPVKRQSDKALVEREPCHKSDVRSKGGTSPQRKFISPINIHEINGFNNGGDFHVVVDDGNICVRKEHINFGLGEKYCHQQFHRKPPDRDRNKGHTYVDLVATHKRLTNGSKYTKLLDRTRCIPWKYGRGTYYDGLGDTYVPFKGARIPLFPRAETMDPLIPNKEIVNLSSPIRLDKLVMFRSVTKLCGEVTFVDVTFVIYPMSSTCLLYYSKASRENLAILGADVSNFRHHYVCAIMPLDNSLVGKRKQKIHKLKWLSKWVRQENKLCAVWSLICHATVSHVDLSVDLIEVEFERVRSYLCFVAYSRCVVMSFRSCVVFVFKDMAEHRSVVVYLTIYSQLRWKHEDLKRRREAFESLRGKSRFCIVHKWVQAAYSWQLYVGEKLLVNQATCWNIRTQHFSMFVQQL